MPSLPRPRRTPQAPRESLQAKALRLAVQLTPMQRNLVARTGLPRWLELPLPFTPHPGRQLAAARALASPEYGLLEPRPQIRSRTNSPCWASSSPGSGSPPPSATPEPLPGPSFLPSPYR